MDNHKRLLLIGNQLHNESRQIILKFTKHYEKICQCREKIAEQELKSRIDEADIVALSSDVEDKKKVINLCLKKGKEVFLVPDLIDMLLNSAETNCVEDTLLLRLKPPGLDERQRFLKRVSDIIIALLMLLAVSPIMILLMLIIPILSPGSAIFTQERLGKNAVPFKVIKFRTMINNAEQKTGPVLAMENDPRITRFGTLLRGTRLDELPQLINVLKGDMSIVGPRPEREFFVDQFTESIPYYGYRMAVKPGITGFAQVKGNYTTEPEDKLRFDIMYIRNYSFRLDIKILFQTIGVVFKKEKAGGMEVKSDPYVKNLIS